MGFREAAHRGGVAREARCIELGDDLAIGTGPEHRVGRMPPRQGLPSRVGDGLVGIAGDEFDQGAVAAFGQDLPKCRGQAGRKVGRAWRDELGYRRSRQAQRSRKSCRDPYGGHQDDFEALDGSAR